MEMVLAAGSAVAEEAIDSIDESPRQLIQIPQKCTPRLNHFSLCFFGGFVFGCFFFDSGAGFAVLSLLGEREVSGF